MHAMVLKAPEPLWHGPSFPTGGPAPAKSGSTSPPAAFAGPTCMWSMVNCRTRGCRSFLATKSSAGSMRSGEASRGCVSASVWAFRGSATPAGFARSAGRRENLCDARCSPATRGMAVSPQRRSPTRGLPFLWARRARCGAGAAVVRGPDRLAVAGDRGRGQEAGPVRLRRGGAYPGAGGGDGRDGRCSRLPGQGIR